MTEPVVFISHFRIKDGQRDAFGAYFRGGATQLQREKPQTVVFLAYADEAGGRISIVHVFPDADAMDRHIEGAQERSQAAYEFIQPQGWEVYGAPSGAALATLQRGAAAAGVPLTVEPAHVGGFLRLTGDVEDRDR